MSLETKQANVLIAKFLGWKQGMMLEWTCPLDKPVNGWAPIYAPDGTGMKFHTDWNWLMLAAKKFDNPDVLTNYFNSAEYTSRCDDLDNAITLYDIDKAFEVLVDNIMWLDSIPSICPGDKVHYIASYAGAEPVNGMIKSINSMDPTHAFVVFNCAGEWDKYKDYTGQSTHMSNLHLGWV